MSGRMFVALVATAAAMQADPGARRLTPAPLKIDGAIGHISAAGELPGGAILVTDQNAPAIWRIAPATGAVTRVGSAGGGEHQYVQPGGIYRGANRTTLVLDRAQSKVLVISPAGAVERAYSIAVRGVTGSSSADRDRQRLDARDLAYFVDQDSAFRSRKPGLSTPALTVVRFDAVKQEATNVVTDLRAPEQQTQSGGPNVILTRQVIGSPADGWGVTPDGRMAVVRAVPYRVDWIAADGTLKRGPEIRHDPLPMTDADKDAFNAQFAKSGGGAGVGTAGGGQTGGASAPAERMFAATKPPFAPDDVLVSPDAKVWVLRTAPFGASTHIYDVFNDAGARVDRIALPATSRVVGFGDGAVFVRDAGPAGPEVLKKYLLK